MAKITQQYKRGNRWQTKMSGVELKVMAVADNYLMVRYLNCAKPFIKYVKEFPHFLNSIGATQVR